MTVVVEIDGLASLKLGENTYPYRNTISRQLTRDLFTSALNGRVIAENDVDLADDTDVFEMEKLNPTHKSVVKFVQDLKTLNNLRQMVEYSNCVDFVLITFNHTVFRLKTKLMEMVSGLN